MTLVDWLVTAVTAAAAAVLIAAGAGKLAIPGPLRRAVAEVFPASGRRVTSVVVRAFGAVEIAVAAGMLAGPVRLMSAIAAAALGACFAVLGVLGLARGARLPCGCFGAASQHPLGWVSITLGAALLAPWPVLAGHGFAGRVPGVGYSTAAVLLTSIGVVLLCLMQNRRLIRLPRLGEYPVASAPVPVPASSEVG
jgi:hypothetical protein